MNPVREVVLEHHEDDEVRKSAHRVRAPHVGDATKDRIGERSLGHLERALAHLEQELVTKPWNALLVSIASFFELGLRLSSAISAL
jgi:hypothetical protein